MTAHGQNQGFQVLVEGCRGAAWSFLIVHRWLSVGRVRELFKRPAGYLHCRVIILSVSDVPVLTVKVTTSWLWPPKPCQLSLFMQVGAPVTPSVFSPVAMKVIRPAHDPRWGVEGRSAGLPTG